MSHKPYSVLAVAIDLVMNEYDITNPIIISEKIYEDLGICTTIHEVSDYLEINKLENEKQTERTIQMVR